MLLTIFAIVATIFALIFMILYVDERQTRIALQQRYQHPDTKSNTKH